MLCEMQSASSRIWTRVAVSISYDDNHYTTGTSEVDVFKPTYNIHCFKKLKSITSVRGKCIMKCMRKSSLNKAHFFKARYCWKLTFCWKLLHKTNIPPFSTIKIFLGLLIPFSLWILLCISLRLFSPPISPFTIIIWQFPLFLNRLRNFE